LLFNNGKVLLQRHNFKDVEKSNRKATLWCPPEGEH